MSDVKTELEPYIDMKKLLTLIPISESMIRHECNKTKNPLPHRRIGNRYVFLWSRVSAWLDSEALGKKDDNKKEKYTCG